MINSQDLANKSQVAETGKTESAAYNQPLFSGASNKINVSSTNSVTQAQDVSGNIASRQGHASSSGVTGQTASHIGDQRTSQYSQDPKQVSASEGQHQQ